MTWDPDAVQPWRDPVRTPSCRCPEFIALTARSASRMRCDRDLGVVQTAATCGHSWPWVGCPHLLRGFLWCFVMCCFQGVEKPTGPWSGSCSAGGLAGVAGCPLRAQGLQDFVLRVCLAPLLPRPRIVLCPAPFEIVFTFYCNVCALGSLRTRSGN